MAAPRILVNRDSLAPSSGVSLPVDASAAWAILGRIGWVFLVVGALDLGLAWFPSAFGSPGWEFGTLVGTANGLPLPVMGLLFALASTLATRRRTQGRIIAAMMVVLAIALLAMAVLFATVAPIAFREASSDLVRSGLIKAATKTGLLLIGFAGLLVWSGVWGWSQSSTRRS